MRYTLLGLRLHITILRCGTEGFGENTLRKDARVGGFCVLFEVLVAHEHVLEHINHYSVSVGENALILLVDFLYDFIERFFFFGFCCSLGSSGRECACFLFKVDCALKGFLKLFNLPSKSSG